MLRRPDVDEVKAYGEALGLDLTSTEARIMHSRMLATIDALEVFNELRLEEHRPPLRFTDRDRKSTRLNSSHGYISYAVFCLKKKKKRKTNTTCNTKLR